MSAFESKRKPSNLEEKLNEIDLNGSVETPKGILHCKSGPNHLHKYLQAIISDSSYISQVIFKSLCAI